MEEINALHQSEENGKSDSIVALIPAHNEQDRVGGVIRVLNEIDLIDRVIVIDDGSHDKTSEIAESNGATVIRLEKNKGKAAAMDHGVRNSSESIILFLDADLISLKKEHVLDLLKPVLENKADMTMGVFRNGRFRTDIAHRISPGLSGQRAILRSVWGLLDNSVPMEKIGYGIERELQALVKEGRVRFTRVYWHGVSQITKEEKLGPQQGLKLRMKMYQDIIKTWTKWTRKINL